MFDWNDNGKIDPIDVSISMMTLEEEEQQKKRRKNNNGCLSSCLTLIAVIFIFIQIIKVQFFG